MLKTTLLLGILAVLCSHLSAQITFKKKFPIQSAPISLDQTPDGRYWIGSLLLGRLTSLDAGGNVVQSMRLHGPDGYQANTITDLEGLADNGLYGLLEFSPNDSSGTSYLQLMRLDQAGELQWQRSLSPQNHYDILNSCLTKDDLENVYAARTIFNTVGLTTIQVFKVDPSGNLLWAKKYDLPSKVDLSTLTCLADGSVLVSAEYWHSSSNIFYKLDPQGGLVWAKTYADMQVYNQVELPGGDLIITAGKRSNGLYHIIRLDAQGNVKWAKNTNIRLGGSLFSTLCLNGEGNVLIMDGTYFPEAAPMICVSPDGNFLWAKNYDPCYRNLFTDGIATLDGGIAGTYGAKYFIKTDGQGDLASCPAFAVDLTFSSAQITSTNLVFPSTDLGPAPQHVFQMLPDTLTVSDFCYEPPPVNGLSLSSDTLCVGELLTAAATGDRPADAYYWEFTNGTPGLADSARVDSVFFTAYGEQPITLQIQYGSCRDTFQSSVQVTAFPAPDLGSDTVLCVSGVPLLLDAFIPQGQEYQWNDGSEESMQEISASGQYTVTVFAGLCAASDTIAVTFAEAPPGFSTDTTLCMDEPLQLSFAVPATASIYWNGSPGSGDFNFTGSGWVLRSVVYDAYCRFEDSIDVHRIDCTSPPPFYAPNVFKPDGAPDNAYFRIFCSEAVELRELKIYDRWGSLVFDSAGRADPVWDGQVKGQRAAPGVYVWRALLRRLGEETWQEGSVTLVR